MIPKFRVFNKKLGEWHDEQELVFCNGKLFRDWRRFEDGFPLNMQDCAVMQSTGLKDKNGVESWEGNYLVKEGYWPFFIKWIESEGCLMAVPVNSVQRTNWKPVSVKDLLDTGYINDGNIWENPELLEAK